MSGPVLVFTTQRPTRRQVARALHAGGMDVRFPQTLAELRDVIGVDPPQLVILDADSVAGEVIEQALTSFDGPKRPPVILISLGQDKAPLLQLIRRHEIGNLVAKHGAIRAVFPVLDERELLVTCQKVILRDIFGLEKYVGSWGVVVHRRILKSLSEKPGLLDEFEGYLTDLDCPSTVVPDIITTAEELVLNAVVHAPRTPEGQPKYEHIGPDPKLVLQPNEYVEVSYACDGQRLMINVADNFGTLNKDKIYSYVSKAYGAEKLEAEQKVSGAGLGLSMAFYGIHQLVFNVQESRRTEAMAGWYLRVNTASEFRQVSKSLNLFWLPADSQPAPETRANPIMAPIPTPLEMKSIEGAPVRMSGRIDENTALAPVVRAGAVDMRGVTGFTSRGVVSWLKLVNGLGGNKLEIIGMPDSMIRLAAEVKGMLRGVQVKSVMALFECTQCSHERYLELVPSEVLVSGKRSCERCSGDSSFAGIREDYESLVKVLQQRK
ncbi:MAG: hypothetical protein HYZ28_03410 [Myxococcales bacterium]|nr:hypothetical protein [Myxococcales bacterium]